MLFEESGNVCVNVSTFRAVGCKRNIGEKKLSVR